MAIEAPISKFKKNNLKIYIAVCIVAAIVFAYDGYLSKYKWSKRYDFYKRNVIDNDGKPTSIMNFNRKSPPFFVGAAILLGAYLFVISNKKLIADENALILPKRSIAYDSIEKVDKTHFDSKGFFIITYKDTNGSEVNHKLSSKNYDNLAAVLEHLVTKIT